MGVVMMIIEKAHAKINLTLDVERKLDNGYHQVKMIMTTLELHDEVTLTKRDDSQIIIKSSSVVIPLDKHNIAFKAAKLLQDKYGVKQGVDIFIEKRIPVAAGLAGGSSDAAATLRGLNQLWKLNLSLEELANHGATIGSDVPFCVYQKTALATGTGTDLEFLNEVPNFKIVLVKPRIGVSTKYVYNNYDINNSIHPNTEAMIEAIDSKDFDKVCETLGNSLESVTLRLYPVVQEIKDKLVKLNVPGVLMSGSGPTVFGLIYKDAHLKRVVGALDSVNNEVIATRIRG